jgi:hypothetical protein
MTVAELINKLMELPPNMEVMIDRTSEKSGMFYFTEINEVEEIKTATDEKMIVLFTEIYN